jgi:hypothetical protein
MTGNFNRGYISGARCSWNAKGGDLLFLPVAFNEWLPQLLLSFLLNLGDRYVTFLQSRVRLSYGFEGGS